MRGKIIAIEGTDCSGKETQTNLLVKRLREEGYTVQSFSFPNYDSPTGKIIGGPYLGKEYIGKSFFEEGAANVDPKVATLYYTADRKYNIDKIEFLLEKGCNVILDRYIYSNMAHHGGKIKDKKGREEMYEFLEILEFDLMKLPKPDVTLFLHMPLEAAKVLKDNRKEAPDGHEKDEKYLKMAEEAYLEISKRYNFEIVECANGHTPKSIEEIHEQVYAKIKNSLNK